MISIVRWKASGSWRVFATVGVKNAQTSILLVNDSDEPVKVKIDYFQEGCSSTGDCQTTLLWDGTTLWVNWLGGHYLGYRPTDPAGFEAAIQRLALEYDGTAIVTS